MSSELRQWFVMNEGMSFNRLNKATLAVEIVGGETIENAESGCYVVEKTAYDTSQLRIKELEAELKILKENNDVNS